MPKLGEGIVVLQQRQFGRVHRIPAVVMQLGKDSFAVRSLREAFDPEGHAFMWLRNDMMGKTWE